MKSQNPSQRFNLRQVQNSVVKNSSSSTQLGLIQKTRVDVEFESSPKRYKNFQTLNPQVQNTPKFKSINEIKKLIPNSNEIQQHIHYDELPLNDQILSTYCDMLNQEQDLFYLYDSFPQVLNSIKQVQQQYGIKSETNPFKTNQSSNKTDWHLQSSFGSQQASNMKQQTKVQSLEKFGLLQNNSSRITDKLKREIGELTQEQEHQKNVRNLSGLVDVQVYKFTLDRVRETLISKSGKKLISIYQLQNKLFKSHVGFCQISVNVGTVPENGAHVSNDVVIHRMFFAKYHRKSQNFFDLIFQLMQYIIDTYNASTVKLKFNSSQSIFMRFYQDMGFKLKSKQQIVGDLVIITLSIRKKDFNQVYKPLIKKTYL